MKLIILVFALISIHNSSLLDDKKVLEGILSKPMKEQFKIWIQYAGRSYDLNSEEALNRYRIYKSTVKRIIEFNSKANSYKLGLGPFSDMTDEEFLKISQGTKFNFDVAEAGTKRNLKEIDFDLMADSVDEANDQFLGAKESKDWSSLYPTVRLQNMSECWAFSTVSVAEGMNVIQNGKFSDLSYQQAVDCANPPRSTAEGAGHIEDAITYIAQYGLALESSYPWDNAKKNQSCRTKDKKAQPFLKAVKTSSCVSFGDTGFNKDCSAFFEQKLQVGPIITCMIEIYFGAKDYQEGILEVPCSWTPLPTHAVAAVYFNENYVKFRNSYGEKWGEKGYGRIKRTLEKNGTKTCFMENVSWSLDKVSLAVTIPK